MAVIDVDLENWMKKLPENLKDLPLIYLAIPGSHDSMTFGLSRRSELAPDVPLAVRCLWPAFKGTIVRWSRTQEADTIQQLRAGIRYFDLRFATKANTSELYFTHALYAGEVTEQFNIFKDFLDSHPEEVIILDCQHFYEFKIEDHRRLLNILVSMFGMRMSPLQRDLEKITLRSLNQQGQQVIVVYRNAAVASSGKCWRGGQMPTPWPRSATTRELLHFLMNLPRAPASAFVVQAVITPTAYTIVPRFLSDVKRSCARPVLQQVLPWISGLAPGRPLPVPDPEDSLQLNVVIADFIDLEENRFPKTIIRLNYKLA